MKGNYGKRFLSVMLSVIMVLGMLPVNAFAADGTNAVYGIGPCDHHECSTDVCGIADAIEGAECTHQCAPDVCSYVAAVEEVLCECTDTDEDGAVDHLDECGYIAPAEGVDCDHEHNEACGYVEAQPAKSCQYFCAICGVQNLMDALSTEVPADEEAYLALEAEINRVDEAMGVLTTEELELLSWDNYMAAKAALGDYEPATLEEPVDETQDETDVDAQADDVIDTYEELAAALTAGDTVTLGGDITVDTKITAIDDTVIDLNGNTLYINVENSYYDNVTIQNGNIVLGKDDVHVCDGYFLVNAGKTLVLNGVKVSSAEGGIKGYAVFHLKTGANLDLFDSELTIEDNEYSAGYIVYAGESTATVDITNTTVTGSNVNGIVHATTVIDKSTFTITDAVEHGINRSGVTINDSTVEISGGTGRGITAQHGPLVITGDSEVTISEMGEATIELRNDQSLTVDETAEVTVDVAVNNTTSGTVTGAVTVKTTPKGDNFTGYTDAEKNKIWGEVWGNATESYVVKVLDADGNVMGTTSLNNIDGIIDGDVKVTWSLLLDAASNTDKYWTMKWTTAPTVDNMPAKVELWIDGVKVSGGDVVLNAPDDLKPIYAVVADDDGKILSYHESLAAAVAAGNNVAILKAGTYAVPTGKDVTITGAVDGVVFDNIGACNMGYANVTFNNVTFDYYPNVNYTGLQHSGNLVYNNCTFNGQVFLYGQSETFNSCTFNQNSADAYNVWTYGAKEVEFNKCTFNSAGKSVLIYSDQAEQTNDVTVTNSTFKASASVEGKAAIEMDSSLQGEIKLNVTDTTATGFDKGNISGNSLWNNKKGNDTEANNDITVTVDDKVVLKPVVLSLSGSGTEEDPFLINNVEDLLWFQAKVDELATDGSTQFAGKYFKLTANIDLAGINWNPIGTMAGDHGSFKGVFDGAGHTISNLNVQQAGNGIGLFARTAGNAIIKNLNLDDVTVKSTDNSNYVGGLVGNAYASTKIENVHVTGDIDISGRGYIGGISGHGYVVMDDVSVVGKGTISSTFWCAGGILGYGGEGATNIMNAHVEGVTITSAAGGLGAIVGMAEDNNGTQPISGSNLSAKNVEIKTYTGAYGDNYANYALGYLYGGNPTSKLTGTNVVKNVTVETSNGVTPTIVDAVATVGDAVYFDLQSAVDAGGEVKVLRDAAVGHVTIPEDAEITIDLNGKTITGSMIAPNAKLTIKNGSIVNTDSGVSALEINAGELTLTNVNMDSARHAVRIDGAVTATINGGTYRGAIGTGKGTYHAMNISGTAKVTIENGTFVGPKGTTADSGSAINVKAGSVVTIKNGNFSGGKNSTLSAAAVENMVVEGGTFDQDPAAYVAEGYEVVKNENGTFTAAKLPVAKVGNTEYGSIDEAIANWTNNTTLTLLADVTLTDVVTLKSTEHHILNLGTYTLTAAEGKNAFVIQACGTGSAERSTITINADATNPGGINAGSKCVVYYKYADGGISTEDRPIIKINGGVFTGSTSSWGTAGIYTIGTAARKCATLNISGGTFNCSINGSGKSKLLISGGTFNYTVSSQGDSTCYRLISGGTFKTLGFMTADSNNTKFWIGTSMGNSNVGVHVDDNGYIVVGGPVVTEAGDTFEASSTNYGGWSSYLQYSSAATNGLYYTSVEEALADNNKTTGAVTVYTDELDLSSLNYKGTLKIEDTLTVTFAEGTTPAWTVATDAEGKEVAYTETTENGVVTRTYSLIKPVAKIGEVGYETFEAALNAVENGETITLLNVEGNESKEIDFTKDISFTITGTAPNYALPTVTFQNATVTIKDAEILIPELDARQNATINVVDSIVHDAGGNAIVKSYYNGAINISGTSKVYTMQVTTMGYITISDSAELNATWQTNVYGNGLITVEDNATFNTAALHLNGKDYSGRDNTDTDRVGKPAEILVVGATFVVGKVLSDNGADYSYNSSKGINIGTVDGKSAVLNIKNGANVNVYMANGETANIGAGGTVNVDGSSFTVECRAADGNVTLANAGTINVSGTSDIAANVTGAGWVYMNGVELDADTKLNGAKVGFINGTNNVVGSVINNGWFSVGIGQNAEAAKVTVGDVTVNVSGDAIISGNGATYSGWVGSAYSADKTQHKYVLNVENALATFGYMHVSKDGELNVKGHATNKYTYDNANVDFYAGELIINGTVTLDGTDAWAKFTKMSVDAADGVLNIKNGTNFESSIHNGSNTKVSLVFYKAGTINVDAGTTVEIDNETTLIDGAKLNIGGTVTAKGTVTGNGTITLTDVNATLAAAEGLTVVTSGVEDYEATYADGTYKLTEIAYVAHVVDAADNVKKCITLDDAFKAAKDGDEVKILVAGTYALTTSGKNITITGAVDGVVFDNIGAKNMGGANVTFNNVTFDYYPNVNYTGLQHSGNLVYNNCTINGQVFLYGLSETFNNCTFNQNSANAYNVWTYGADVVNFNECTFNSAGKSVLIYSESATEFNDVTVTKSTFKASSAVEGKAAIEMDSSLTKGINLTVDGATTATGFDNGNVSGNSLWNNKKWDSTEANNDITVVVNNETVLAPVTFIAKIGETGFTSIADAIEAANAGETVTILADDYTTDISVNKAITVVGETDAEGENLVNITGRVSVSSGATVKNLNVHNEKTGTYDCALCANGSNIVIDGVQLTGYNGMRYCYAKGDITIKNSTINGSNFAVHFDGSDGGNLVIENCDITGWVSYGGGIDKVTLKDSTFKKGAYSGQRSYAEELVIEGSTFDAGYNLDIATTAASNVTVTNSKMSNGSSIVDLFNKEDAVSNNITIDGEKLTYVAKIGNDYYATLEDALADVTDWTTIKLVADATLDYNAREAYGRATTTDIIIDGQGHTLTLNQKDSDWSSVGMANADGKLTLKNMTIEKTGYGDTSGAWNTHAINFTCNVEMNEVKVNNAIAVQNGATLTNVTINEANGYYGLWINGNGQTVTVNGGGINATNGGRGIKIADQYIDAPASVNLTVDGTKFTTAKKAAVLVSSKAGAAITASNVDIANVTEDLVNFVWVDEDWSTHYNKVTVTGGTVVQESLPEFQAAFLDADGKVISYFKTLQAAIDAAEAGQTVTVIKDVTVDSMVTISKALTLDLGGYTITGTGAVYRPVKVAGNNSDINVKITNGTIKTENVTTKPNQAAALLVYDGADVTLEKVTLSGSNYGVMMAGYYDYADGIANNNTTSLEVNEGTVITAANAAIIPQGSYPNVDIEINVGAAVTSTHSIAIYMPTKGNLTVKGGTITGATAIYLKCGNLAVKGGTIVANGDKADYEYKSSGADATGDAIVIDSCGYLDGSVPTASITGGAISSANAETVASYAGNGVTEPVKGFITGGTYKTAPADALLASGYEVEYDTTNRVFGIVPSMVASVNGIEYATLTEAIEAAKNNGIIYLKNNVVRTEDVKVPENAEFTLEMNGFTLNGYILAPNAEITIQNGSIVNTNSGASAIEINEGKLVLNDVNIDSARHAVRIDGAVEATINGGTYKLIGSGLTQHAVNVSGEATVTIIDGTFTGPKGTASDSGAAVNVQTGASVTIEGGTFSNGLINTLAAKGTLKVTGGKFDQDPTAYVAEGYVATEAEGTWTVALAPVYVATVNGTEYESLQEAINKAAAGDTITLIADVEENVTVDKNITIDGAKKNYTGKMTIANGKIVTVQNVNFVNGGIEKAKGTTGNLTVTDCDFDGAGTYYYAIRINGASTLVVERCNVKDYLYSFLYVNSGTNTVSVKDVTVEDCPNYAVYFASGVNNATFENLTVKNSDNGFIINNTALRAFTIKNCKLENVTNAISEAKGTNTITCTVLGNENVFGTAATSQYAKYVLSAADATLTAPEGATVTTTVEGMGVLYRDGKYLVGNNVAQIGDVQYESLQAAINAAQTGDTIVLQKDITLADDMLHLIDNEYDTYFLVEGKNITVDLNGKNISGAYAGANTMLVGVFSTDNEGHLTLTGNGTVDVTATNTVYCLIANYEDECSITIENGTYTLNKAKDCLLYTGSDEGLIINGGTFTLGNVGDGKNGQPWIFNALGGNACSVTVNGGTFNSDVNHQFWANEVFVPGDLALKANDDGTWKVVDAAAYVVEKATSSNSYERQVGYATLQEAYDTSAAEITLLADNAEPVEISRALTIFRGAEIFTAENIKVATGYKLTEKIVERQNAYVIEAIDAVAMIGETPYATVAEALAAAQSGDTVKLVADATESMVIVYNGVTLDLNGNTLNADYVNAFAGNNIVDNSAENKGLLKVAKTNLALAKNNAQLPVWNGVDCYVFTTTSFNQRMENVDVENSITTLRFKPGTEEAVADVLTEAARRGEVSIAVELSWGQNNTQTYVYTPEVMVPEGKQGIFKSGTLTLTISGIDRILEDGEVLTVQAKILSDVGVEKSGDPLNAMIAGEQK